MKYIYILFGLIVLVAVSWAPVVQSKPVSCSIYEKRFNLAKAKFEMDKENFIQLLTSKKIQMRKTQSASGKVQFKLPLKHPKVKSLIGSSLAMATHEALLQKCHEQASSSNIISGASSAPSFTLEERDPAAAPTQPR